MTEPKTYTEQATVSEILSYISETIDHLHEGEAIADLYNLICSGKAKYIGDSLFEIEYPE